MQYYAQSPRYQARERIEVSALLGELFCSTIVAFFLSIRRLYTLAGNTAQPCTPICSLVGGENSDMDSI